MRNLQTIDQELHLAVQSNDPQAIHQILSERKPKIGDRLLIDACEKSDLQCLVALLPHATKDEIFQSLEYAITRDCGAAVQIITQHSMSQDQWNHALWRACVSEKMDMVDLLYPKADIQAVDAMFQELDYTPDETAYLIFLEYRQRQKLKNTLTEETRDFGVDSGKLKM